MYKDLIGRTLVNGIKRITWTETAMYNELIRLRIEFEYTEQNVLNENQEHFMFINFLKTTRLPLYTYQEL